MAKHAARNVERTAMAPRVTFALRTVGSTQLELEVEDNGIGFDAAVARAVIPA